MTIRMGIVTLACLQVCCLFGARNITHPAPIYNMGFLQINQVTHNVFVGASGANAGTYALAAANASSDFLTPLAPQTAIVNGAANTANPVYNNTFLFLDFLNQRPCGVLNDPVYQNKLICYTQYANASTAALAVSAALKDAGGILDADSVVAFTSMQYVLMDNSARMFVLLKPTSGAFGTGDSAFAVAHFDLTGTNPQIVVDVTVGFNGASPNNLADLLKIGASVVTIHNDVPSGDPAPVLFINSFPAIAPWYAGFNVTGTTGALSIFQNARSIIADPAAIVGNKIVGSNASPVNIAALHLSSIHGQTGVDYLLVNGGVYATGNIDAVKNCLYALPLVNDPLATATIGVTTVPVYGMLAKKTAVPVKGVMSDAATVAADLYDDNDTTAMVGNDVAPGIINDVWVVNDTVFVNVSEGIFTQAGVFSSQPVYAPNGSIGGWTSWTRVAVPAAALVKCVLDISDGSNWYISAAGNELYQTQWQMVSSAITDAFSSTKGGVQGFYDISGYAPTGTISVLVSVGSNRCVLLQTGASDAGGKFGPVSDQSIIFNATNGSFSGLLAPVDGIVVSGGVLTDNKLTSAQVVLAPAGDPTDSYLLVSGSDGCAILCSDAGGGWPITGLTKNFANMPDTLSFRRLTNLKFVRHLTTDGVYVYLACYDKVARVRLDSAQFLRGENAEYEVVTRFGNNVYISDFVADQTRMIVATNAGLFYSDNQGQNWTVVDLPFSAGAVSRIETVINPLSELGHFLDGANLYVLSGDIGRSQAREYVLISTYGSAPQLLNQNVVPYAYIWSSYRALFKHFDGVDFAAKSGYIPRNQKPVFSLASSNNDAGLIHFSGMCVNAMTRVSAHGTLAVADEFNLYSCI
ncbi:MAG: hypothetical protein UU47_C0001G0031 [candidate division TM6 bacterium GW2011_GWE2_41_16]|nr:MAG: hypothetical protein UU47_C0001G0031 [candidate division TM6 bacterium GW2011_GWE2_41_16]